MGSDNELGFSSQEMLILRSVLTGKKPEHILDALNKVIPGIFQMKKRGAEPKNDTNSS